MDISTECGVESDMIPGSPDEDYTEKGETRVLTIQPTERETTRGEVRKKEECIANQTKDSYCRIATAQVGMSESKFQIDHNELLVRK